MKAALIMMLVFFVLIILNVPMAVGIGVAALVGMSGSAMPLSTLGQSCFQSFFSFSNVAIPFFILAGNIMSEGGITEKLTELAKILVGRLTGGLAMVVVVASAFFAALSGSSTATTVAIGGMMTPELLKEGYDHDYALAVAASGGVIGPIIPPSIGFILYGVATTTSISDLFLGGIIPGLLMMFFMMIAVYITAKKNGYGSKTSEKFSFSALLKTIWSAKWALLVPVIILGGIYGGAFTPTEAGAVACVYALIISIFVEKRMNFKKLIESLVESSVMSASVLFMLGSATVFGRIMVLAQIPQKFTEFVVSITNSGFTAMVYMNILLLIAGCIMDATANILILSPILLPVAEYYGYSAVHFGVILVANITIGAVTPPVGCCLFAASVMGNRPIEKIAKKAIPFLIALVAALVVTIIIPGTVEWLPELIG